MSIKSNQHSKAKCLTIEAFDNIASYIEENGLQSHLSEILLADRTSIAWISSTDDKVLALDGDKIIIKDKSNIIPPYFLSKEHNTIDISAYYSRFDSEQDVETRKEDWCNLVAQLTD